MNSNINGIYIIQSTQRKSIFKCIDGPIALTNDRTLFLLKKNIENVLQKQKSIIMYYLCGTPDNNSAVRHGCNVKNGRNNTG